MVERDAVAAMVEKRAELAGRIEDAYAGLERLLADAAALDTTLRLFDPDISLDAIVAREVRQPYSWANPGHIATRAVLDVLRLAPEPISIAYITTQVMADAGADAENTKAWELATRRVGKILRVQRYRGLARSRPGKRLELLWEVVRQRL